MSTSTPFALLANATSLPWAEIPEWTPADFVERVLAKAFHAKAVIVGDNFRFGHRQAGDTRILAELGRHFGFETDVKNIGPVGPKRGIFHRQPLAGKRSVQPFDGNAIVVGADETAPNFHVHAVADIDSVIFFDSRTADTHMIDGGGLAALENNGPSPRSLQNYIAHGHVVACFKTGHISARSFAPGPIVSYQNTPPANGDIRSIGINRPFDDAPSGQIERLVAGQSDKPCLVNARAKIDDVWISRVRRILFRRIGKEQQRAIGSVRFNRKILRLVQREFQLVASDPRNDPVRKGQDAAVGEGELRFD